jgi:cytochrome c
MLGKRLLVVSSLAVPLTIMACGDGESSSPMPFTPAGGTTGNPSPDPSMTNGEPPGTTGGMGSMTVSTPGEATPTPTLDPNADPDGDGPGMENMPTEPPPPPVLPTGGTFEKTVLNNQPGEPISLAVLPDGRVLHSSRDGRIFVHQLDGSNPIAANIPVYRAASYDEDGLLGVAVAPDFADDPWVYVYYSPPLNTPTNDAPADGNNAAFQPYVGENRLSRFRFDGNQLVLDSEQTILRVTVDRGRCCHTGGNIDFDGAGNLYLSTGDDSYPYGNLFTPIDERLNRNPAFDAQRSSGNTNDLRGKLLRIRVQADGSYTIPEGNLFPEGTAQTRPEIYAMGLRNPYRFAVNRANGEVYLADYAPDAGQANPTRGPRGTGKWLVVRRAANYGWPYCIGHLAYVDYNFATNTSGAPFDCDNLRNDSPRNTGLVELPPVTDPELMYGNGQVPGFPALGNGAVAPMGGPVYVFDPPSTSPIKWPAEYDGGIMFYEWDRDLIADFRLGADGSLASATRVPIPSIVNPIDIEFGPDGALYVLEYGSNFGGPAPDAALSRIEYRVPAP